MSPSWRSHAPAAAALLLAVACASLLRSPAGPAAPAGSGGAAAHAAASGPATAAAEQHACPYLSGSDGGSSSNQRHIRPPAPDGLFIVRFREYAMAEAHQAELEAALPGGGSGGWQWVQRRNPAAAFPTDFGLLRLAPGGEAALKARLAALPFVKDVHPERVLTRSLMAASAEAVAAGQRAQFAACGADGSSEEPCVAKRPGRMQTRPTFSLEDNLEQAEEEAAEQGAPAVAQRVGNDSYAAGTAAPRQRRQRHLLQSPETLASILQADKVWAQGFKGQGVKMGVFDTGIKGDHPDVKHIVERSNWTHEPTLDDGLGHGSFVAGVVAGTDASCPGLAPEVSLYTFRVFTNDQVSYTSWFLDAFNYAMALKMNIVNLSIGGPDYLDLPFVEKVAEITSSGIIMVSAIGNDGPLYGTLNNPADQNDVIGIGGIDYNDQIAPFSSRGMSTWEIPLGYGRSKPDVMAYGRDVQGSRIGGGCRSLSGTSVASPVVAGAVCLLSSTVPEDKRWKILNPASMKQALVEGAVRLPELNLYEQGAGKLSVINSKAVLDSYTPRASLVPGALHLADCPYMWPFCRQPLYAGAMPVMFNATILNGMGLVGRLEAPPVWTPADEGGQLLDIEFEYSGQLWPWSGYLALYIRVKEEGREFEGSASGEFSFTVVSPPAKGETAERRSTVKVPLSAQIIRTPPRSKRVLWDQFHSIRYPPAYFPRDDLQVRHDILDWHGDHPHTNYHDMFNALRDDGYFLEVLASPLTCFNASNYGAVMIVDSEDEFYKQEIAKLAADVEKQGLGLLVFADWYHLDTIHKLRFFDDNTRSWWDAATGGANVPALNDLLVPFGAAFEAGALDADVVIEGVQQQFRMASGVTLKALPAGAWVHHAQEKKRSADQPEKQGPPVLGLFQHGTGRVGLYGDSNCLDSSHSRSKCFKLLSAMLAWAAGGDVPALTPAAAQLAAPHGNFAGLPSRRTDYNFTEVSPVLQHPLKCYRNSARELQGASFAQWDVAVERPPRQGIPGPGQQQQQQQAGGASATQQQQAGSESSLRQRAEELAAKAKAEADEAAAAKAKAQAEAERQRQQHVAAETAAKKAEEEAAAAAAAAAAVRQQQEQQQQGQQGQGQAGGGTDGGGAIITDAEGRQHPDIDALPQAGLGGPLDVAKEQRPLQPADSGQAGAQAGGEGTGAAAGSGTRFASLVHQQEAGSLTPEGGGKRGSVLRLSLIQGVLLLSIAGLVVWARSRRRRGLGLPLRVHSRKLLLPVWGRGSEGEERNRHE